MVFLQAWKATPWAFKEGGAFLQFFGDGPFGWIAEQVYARTETRDHHLDVVTVRTDHLADREQGCATGSRDPPCCTGRRSGAPTCRRSGCLWCALASFTANRPPAALIHWSRRRRALLIGCMVILWLAGTASCGGALWPA